MGDWLALPFVPFPVWGGSTGAGVRTASAFYRSCTSSQRPDATVWQAVWLWGNDITTLSLEVLCGNPAGLAFWKRQGLVPVATVCQQNLDEGDHQWKRM